MKAKTERREGKMKEELYLGLFFPLFYFFMSLPTDALLDIAPPFFKLRLLAHT